MNENAKVMVEKIVAAAEDGRRSVSLDIRPLIINCTLDTICETAMGVRVGAQSDNDQKNQAYVQPINTVLRLLINRMLQPLYQSDWVYRLTGEGRQNDENLDKIHTFVRKVSFMNGKNQI